MSTKSVTSWLVGLTLLLAAPAMAQSDSDLEKQIKEASALPEQMDQAIDRVIEKVTNHDAEQKALLKKLGEADERARQEKARADALAGQLSKLTGANAPLPTPADITPGTATVPPPSAIPTVVIPERRVNGLGMVESAATALADVSPESNEVRFVPLAELESTAGALRIEQSGGRVAFLHDDGLANGAPLAYLQLDAGKLVWRWAERVVGGARPTLATLDRWLATGVIEAASHGNVTGRWQVAPVNIDAELPPPSATDRLELEGPAWAVGLPLDVAAEEPVVGWIVEAAAPQRQRLLSGDAVLALEWNAQAGKLGVQHQPMQGGTAAQLDQQIAAWEKDRETELAKDSPSERELARYHAELERLRATRSALDAMSPSGSPGEAKGVLIRLIASNGVTCVRFVLNRE